DEHLPVLKRAHGARIDVDVGVQLDVGDADAARLEDRGEGGGGDAFPERGNYTTGYENILGHEPTACRDGRVYTKSARSNRAGAEWRPAPRYEASSARFLKCSSASGLASASRLRTGLPWTASRTASSTILPLLVRGMSATCKIFAGTWRGVVLSRMRFLILFATSSESSRPSRSFTKSTTRTSPACPGGQSCPMTSDSTTSSSCSTWR